jgi:hypothetical protein
MSPQEPIVSRALLVVSVQQRCEWVFQGDRELSVWLLIGPGTLDRTAEVVLLYPGLLDPVQVIDKPLKVSSGEVGTGLLPASSSVSPSDLYLTVARA